MLTVKALSRAFANTPVLRRVDLDVTEGEIICLLGASGSGKTTLLRIIAGLETADAGEVLLDGRSIMNVPVHQRDVGLMFQDFALFPHLNVAENVAFGLKMRGVSPQAQAARVDEVLALVGLSGFDARDVAGLSGGERQRVALARSLALTPRLLLLDEPLGSLDAGLRARLALDLRAIIKRAGLTAMYVTHDQAEAFAIADRIAVMHQGEIEQIDAPEKLYFRPQTTFVAHFLGLTNILPIIRRNGDRVHTAVGDFQPSSEGEAAYILLHPDGLRLASGDGEGITGMVKEYHFLGNSYRLTLQHASGVELVFDVPSFGAGMPEVGAQVQVSVAPEGVIPLRA